jgi:hypothetical protein
LDPGQPQATYPFDGDRVLEHREAVDHLLTLSDVQVYDVGDFCWDLWDPILWEHMLNNLQRDQQINKLTMFIHSTLQGKERYKGGEINVI